MRKICIAIIHRKILMLKYCFILHVLFLSTASANNELTIFKAEYDVLYRGIHIGTALFGLFPTNIENQYKYQLETNLGLLGLSDKRSVITKFIYDKKQDIPLLPLRFIHERKGTGVDYSEQIAFAKELNKVFSKHKNEKKTFSYESRLFDVLTPLIQIKLDTLNGGKEFIYKVIKSNRIKEYKFKYVGTEILKLNKSQYSSIKYAVIRDEQKRQTNFWLAPKFDYLPIKLTHSKKGVTQITIKLKKYHMLDKNSEAKVQKRNSNGQLK